MEIGLPDFVRATAEASAGSGKGKKKVLILASEGPRAEHSSGKIVGGQEQELEEIEGLNWDDDRLANEIDICLGQLKDTPRFDLDDESYYLDEERLRLLNQRLALCRLRGHEESYQDMDDDSLAKLITDSALEAKDYYKHYECSFDWFFDPVYCRYAHLEDYQRLMLKNNGGYEDWEYYRKICSPLEGDQDFVQFWEKLSSRTKLIELYMTEMTREPKIGRLFYYHALKIAAGYPNVYKTLIRSGFIEFRHRVQIEFTWHRRYADFLFLMWKLRTGEKLSFESALSRVYDDRKYSFIFVCKKFERNLGTLEELYKPFLDRIGEETDEDYVKGLIIKFVKGKFQEGTRKTYYDYAKRKLSIAKDIGLVPSPPT